MVSGLTKYSSSMATSSLLGEGRKAASLRGNHYVN
jgi:hypothetical protein